MAQSAEVTACNEFLEYISYSFATETLSRNWLVTTKVESKTMTLTIEKEKEHFDFIAFDKEEIEFVVDTIADFEFTKFEILRQYGWCSSNQFGDSRIGFLEFVWLNQDKLFGKSDLVSKCTCQFYLDRFDDLDEIVDN